MPRDQQKQDPYPTWKPQWQGGEVVPVKSRESWRHGEGPPQEELWSWHKAAISRDTAPKQRRQRSIPTSLSLPSLWFSARTTHWPSPSGRQPRRVPWWCHLSASWDTEQAVRVGEWIWVGQMENDQHSYLFFVPSHPSAQLDTVLDVHMWFSRVAPDSPIGP